jgi:uncharacterized OsmC-like protein
VGNARGEVELEGKVLVLKRIHVTYTGFELADADRTTVQRVLDTHMQGCPVARSIGAAIDVTTSVAGL